MKNYLRIYRPLNLLFIGIAQWMCAFFLDIYATFQSILDGGIYPIILGTVAAAAFGYWVNDYYDVKRDIINKPENRGVRNMSKPVILIHLIAFCGLILYAGMRSGLFFLLLFIAVAFVLWLYSAYLKDRPGIGNFLIAFLSFISIYMLKWKFPEIDFLLLLHFAVLSGLINWSRELVKDAEDSEGDAAVGARTIPIVFGMEFTNRMVYFLCLFTISFIVISLYYQRVYFTSPLKYIYWVYYLTFIIAPLYKIAVNVRFENNSIAYSRLSAMLKYVLYTGILSILFF